MKKNILLFTTLCLMNIKNVAASTGATDVVEDEGRLSVKFRIFGALPKSTQTGFPTPSPVINASTEKLSEAKVNEDLVNTGGGGLEFATEVFLTDHFATEFALGFGAYATNTLTNVAFNFENASKAHATAKDPSYLWFVPITLGVKYFVAPFGAISPYVGVGYSYQMFFTMSEEYSVANAHTGVVQLGIDFVTKDDAVYSLDVKKAFQKPQVSYRDSFIAKIDHEKECVAKMEDFSPWVISLGVGYKF